MIRIEPAPPIAEGRAVAGGITAYCIPGSDLVSVTTVAAAANEVRYAPLYVVTPIVLDRIACEVTGASGTLARLGIYNADTSWQPTSLVLDAGTVSTGSTGVKEITISQPLAPGRYLTAFNCNATPTMRLLRAAARYVGLVFGASPFYTITPVAQAFGAFPATGTAWATLAVSGSAPIHLVAVRLSTA